MAEILHSSMMPNCDVNSRDDLKLDSVLFDILPDCPEGDHEINDDVFVARYQHIIDSIIKDQDHLVLQKSDVRLNEGDEPWKELIHFRSNQAKNLLIGALNINSLRNKFDALKQVLTDGFIDVLTVCETKLDVSFPFNQFSVKGFFVHRQDSSARSGGIIAWVRNDLPNNRRFDMEINDSDIQSICLELHINKEKWFVLSIYRLPDSCVDNFVENLCKILDKVVRESSMIIINGDMNVDMSKCNYKSGKLTDILNLYNLCNKVNTPTCFKGAVPSIIDLCIVSQPKRFGPLLNWNCGLSDWHNLIVISTKLKMPRPSKSVITYRSYKKFNTENFSRDISYIPFHVLDVFDDIDDKYWMYNALLLNVVDEHAPVKTRYLKGRGVPHMNSELKKLMYKKRMLQNAYWRQKGNSNLWEKFRKARNDFVRANRKSRQNYFRKNCQKTNKRSFWETVKPFFTDKISSSNDIMLKEGDNIITRNDDVADVFNTYYQHITDQIGFNENVDGLSVDDIILKYENHPSIKLIKDKCNIDSCSLHILTEKQVHDILSKVNPKKAAGYDNFPPKLLRLAKNELTPSFTYLINCTIKRSIFPRDLKLAEISPCFKKGNPLDKSKYRPVSVLSCISKIFECAINIQICDLFYDKKAGRLSAYRKMFNTQSLLTKAVDDWKSALDNGRYCGALLMDLSKAFDVIPHGLLIAKLSTYGFDENSVRLIYDYLSDRRQRVKIRHAKSSWIILKKGVPQGSVLGPTLFNVFINDLLFNAVDQNIYNYADDNTVSYVSQSMGDLKSKIEIHGNLIMDWFAWNGMQTNPDKFQAIIFGMKGDMTDCFSIQGHDVKCSDTVKLLGINIDRKLVFDKHVSSICAKASHQINAIMRLSNKLDTEVKVQMFFSFIKSTISYCPVVWMFCGNKHIRKLEKLQYRALKFVYNDFESSYSVLLNKSGTLSVNGYLKYMICIEVYKCVNDLSPQYLCELFSKKDQVYDMRDYNKLNVARFNTITYGKNSFSYHGAKMWNELPIHVKESVSMDEFKMKLKANLMINDNFD